MIYAGATVTLLTGALDPKDRTQLLAGDVAGVTYTIIGPGNVELAADVPMVWDNTVRRFVAEYDLPAGVVGGCLAGVVWHGLNGSVSPTWRPFHVEARPTT